MNHFIYAMTSTDRAPATGGDTKSWFEYYKWDVDDFAYVPVGEDVLPDYELNAVDLLWFVMDGDILGCVPVQNIIPSLQGSVELHYHTQDIQVGPTGALAFKTHEKTGRVGNPDTYEALKRRFDAEFPPRKAATESLQSASV